MIRGKPACTWYLSRCIIILLWTSRDWLIYTSTACVYHLIVAGDYLRVHKYIYNLNLGMHLWIDLVWICAP